jgi:IS5 family transposase
MLYIQLKGCLIVNNFRAGVEVNISELKRVFGGSKAIWKGLDGFKAFV